MAENESISRNNFRLNGKARPVVNMSVPTLKNKYNGKNVLIENIFIGIDTGVHTGFAVWSATRQMFIDWGETKIHRAMFRVLRYAQHQDRYRILGVRVEDARKRSVDKNNPIYRQRLQSAGSVKRDASVWEDFLKDYRKYFQYQMVAPQANFTKLPEEEFARRFGLVISSDHVRDACMLVANLENKPMLSDSAYNRNKE